MGIADSIAKAKQRITDAINQSTVAPQETEQKQETPQAQNPNPPITKMHGDWFGDLLQTIGRGNAYAANPVGQYEFEQSLGPDPLIEKWNNYYADSEIDQDRSKIKGGTGFQLNDLMSQVGMGQMGVPGVNVKAYTDIQQQYKDDRHQRLIDEQAKPDLIDDGTKNIANLESPWITNGELYRQWEADLVPGMDEKEAKRLLYEPEAVRYKYDIPGYKSPYASVNLQNSPLGSMERMFTDIGDIQDVSAEDNFKLDVNGKHVDSAYTTYLDLTSNGGYFSNNVWYPGDPDIPDTAKPYILSYQLVVPDEQTGEIKRSVPFEFDDVDKFVVDEAGTISVLDADGNWLSGGVENIQNADARPAEEGETPSVFANDYEPDTGQALDYADVVDLLKAFNSKDSTEEVQFQYDKPIQNVGGLAENKPSFLRDYDKGVIENLMTNRASDVVSDISRAGLGSLEYMIPGGIGLGIGASNAAVRSDMMGYGIDPQTHHRGTYYRIQQDPNLSPEEKAMDMQARMASTFATPFVERSVGNIGGGEILGKAFTKGINAYDRAHDASTLARGYRMADSAAVPWINRGLGMTGEGVEEILAAPIENISTTGVYGLFADKDEDRDPDIYGRNYYQIDQGLVDRGVNAAEAAPDDFLMGAGVSILPNLPGASIDLLKTPSHVARNKAAKTAARRTRGLWS